MKHLIAFILWGITFNVFAATPPSRKTTSRYEAYQQQTVTLPTRFAKPFIIDQSDINLLSGKTIHHVDLVYTKFRSSPNFNQEALNKKRVLELKKLLPQIHSDSPTWSWVEQTGATDRETASTYFHGFVIHYSDKATPNALREFLSDKAKPMTTFSVSSEQGGNFTYSSGTKLSVPADAVAYADGTPVKGAFELQYREFRNPAEIALSGLPMTYTNNGYDYNFSSIGMYEIRGIQGDKELQLKKPVTVDFNCTKVVDDAAFYRMDDATGDWKKIEPIVFDDQATVGKKTPVNNQEMVPLALQELPLFGADFALGFSGSISSSESKTVQHLNSTNGKFMEYKRLEEGMEVKMNPGAWKEFKRVVKDSAAFNTITTSYDEEQRKLTIQPNDLNRLTTAIFGHPINLPVNQQIQGLSLKNDPGATLLASGADANHTYPTLVRGLNSTSFGVYNADQIYRIGKPQHLSPVYTDAATGKTIADLHVACLIDLTYNGSFSFQPNNIICNPNGRNVLLLFTNDKKTYLIDEETFAKTDKTNLKVNLLMQDVTDQLKTPEDLKQLLKI